MISHFMTPLNILLCAICCFSTAQTIEDIIHVKLNNDFENGILENEEVISDCQVKDLTKWDKLFTMLENSQMRENILLETVNEVVSVELQSLRAEMLQFVSSFAGACASHIESATTKITTEVNSIQALASKCEQAQRRENSLDTKKESDLEKAILLNFNISDRISRIEEDLKQEALRTKEDSYNCAEASFTLAAVLRTLDETTAKLQTAQSWISQRYLPGGCEIAILFPMRSPKIYASVHPADMTLQAFSFCVWVKVTEALDRTIIFSYGTKRNPYEIQLYLNHQSLVLVIGDGQNKVIADNVVEPSNWTNVCGTWSSENGKATLWVNRENRATSYDIAKGYEIPNRGIFQLGQEKNGCCVGGGFDESLSFSGKITGFNFWNKVLSDGVITWTGTEESCSFRGNIVGWGTTEILLHGGAQYIH
ncbi:hypothetical protein XENTR_v10014578 [Xenopus tropicalis]|uniref:Pentraxin-related protein PTX3 n=1 Tax=Xenopus tropicalis TaxID=8364 RepID=F6VKJ0_XENTR|nr:pentraxin-related protein PTX3 [Xenopus tropicalis]KAE8604114.1 hypothetical protein XENTR_v10014578 [Xenopus tropicalis]|eukprot:XP_002933289.2 PREDICTED: pentraxin-related protein PTX3 [Xenopus tropicalis]